VLRRGTVPGYFMCSCGDEGPEDYFCEACGRCETCCSCEDFDADELGLDPEEEYDA